MNLYQISDRNYEWSCFVFDETRNHAKMRVADHFGEDYLDMRCKTLKLCVNVSEPMIVDSDTDEGYSEVLRCGFYYREEE